MLERVLTQLLYLFIIFPFCYFSLKNKSKKAWKIFGVFCVYFIAIQLAVFLPLEYEFFDFVGGDWNWSGKIYSIIISVIFLFLHGRTKLKDYNITFKQNENSLIVSLFLILFLIVFASVLGFGAKPISFDFERFAYQFSMPGLDEELAYRGIMLGLLSQIFVPLTVFKKYKLNLSIFITSILFGLIHSLYIKNDFSVTFNSYYFSITFITGFVQGYISFKSGSVLLPIIGHNLYNTVLQIFKMFIN